MSDVLDDFMRIRNEEETARTRVNKAEGALDEVMLTIKKEFGCKTLSTAELALKKLRAEEKIVAKKFQGAVSDYDKKWDTEDD